MIPSRRVADQGSWSDLVAGIVTDATQLFRKEVELAQIEIRNDLLNIKTLVTGIAIGAFLAVLGVVLLSVALALALIAYTTLPPWLCFGIVGGALLLAGMFFIIMVVRSKKKIDIIPQRTVEAVKEDIGWITSTVRTSNATSKNANKLDTL